ncbi:Hypothetical predicted protein [Olea europaea subsp. europaea]|uniref:Uncharacterized protein n=1 Tax=Olea europaea subsp. europaea TaxID=158383 RepID=A0A8S0VCR8_OLEEU|nr:Hypothetical predicted protein [Olea europaea subsp. europaea]
MVFSRRAASSSVVYATLFHIYILQLVDSHCPKQFQCGNLGNLEFPLANSPGCGLFTVECNASSKPKIHLDNLWPPSPYSYEILEKLSSNELVIRNPILERVLYSNDYTEVCKFFSHLPVPHFPKSPSISISFFPNITLFKCAKYINYDNEIPHFQDIYGNYDGCDSFKIHYPKSNGSLPPPKGCSALPLPSNLQCNSDSLDLFQRLSADYHLEWNVSVDCLNCHRGGGNCTTKTDKKFRCENEKEKRRDFKKILAAGKCGKFQ